MKNAFTVDFEAWYCSHLFADSIPFEQWDRLDARLERPTELLLQLLGQKRVRATFFVLGCMAERFPALIRAIQREGHEIASHGYAHRQITRQTADAFERDIRQAKAALMPFGVEGCGYRAPAFSVTRRTLWATDILKAHGFTYDSSVYPTGAHPDYGISDAPLRPYHHANGLLEIPMSVAEYGPLRVPCSGGGYLRQMPYGVFRSLAARCHRQGRPLVFYIHPWELDPGLPKMPLKGLAALRHYRNLHTTAEKIRRLLGDFSFGAMSDCFTEIPRLAYGHA